MNILTALLIPAVMAMAHYEMPTWVNQPATVNAVVPDSPADQAGVRRANLGLVLRHLRDHGPRSRARIAQETGLNKATVSSLVAELAARRLVVDGEVDRAGSVGRPGLTVHLDGRCVCGIGVELNVDYAAVLVLDLRGEVMFEKREGLDAPALGPQRTLDALARLVDAGAGVAVGRGRPPTPRALLGVLGDPAATIEADGAAVGHLVGANTTSRARRPPPHDCSPRPLPAPTRPATRPHRRPRRDPRRRISRRRARTDHGVAARRP
jgi:hypothetical protein